MIGRYKEILFGLLLGLAMWIADAQMHAMMPTASAARQSALIEELFSPDGPPLVVRLLYVSFALLVGWLLWRSNQHERGVCEPEWQERLHGHEVVYAVTRISDATNKLLRSGEWEEQDLEAVSRIRHYARQIEDFVGHLPHDTETVALERPLFWEVELKVANWWERLKAANVAQSLASISLMVAVGFAVRFIAVLFVYDEQLTSPRGDFEFGWEVGRVANSLAAGRGFSSPLWGETGLTAWVPPVFPLLLAGVFKIFGSYTAASAIAALSLNSLFSALTSIPIVLIARKIFDNKVATLAGWAWAFFPYAIFISAFRVWGEGLDALLVVLLLLVVLRLAESHRASLWFGCGALTGFAALTNPNTMSVMPGLLGWACYRLRHNGANYWKPLSLTLSALLIVVAPWFMRNYKAFDQFVPFRSNFWLEAQLGNNQQAVTLMTGDRHPASNKTEMEEYRHLGELDYMAEQRRQTLAFIAANPASFAWLTARRVVFVWTGFWSFNPSYLASEPLQIPFVFFSTTLSLLMVAGLFAAWRRRNPLVATPVILLVCQPLVYYFTHPAIEYRHALEPVIIILAVVGGLRLKVGANRHVLSF